MSSDRTFEEDDEDEEAEHETAEAVGKPASEDSAETVKEVEKDDKDEQRAAEHNKKDEYAGDKDPAAKRRRIFCSIAGISVRYVCFLAPSECSSCLLTSITLKRAQKGYPQ